jgi:hypothetical protein
VALVELPDKGRDSGVVAGVGSRLIGWTAHWTDARDGVIHGTAAQGGHNIPHGCELPDAVAGEEAGGSVTTLTWGGSVTTLVPGAAAVAPADP